MLLIDEIDKAPRDFPNDLLHEVQEMRFRIKETNEEIVCDEALRPILFITSNDERRLPDAFLRRCVSHHIELTDDLLRDAIKAHAGRFPALGQEFIDLAIRRFMAHPQPDARKAARDRRVAGVAAGPGDRNRQQPARLERRSGQTAASGSADQDAGRSRVDAQGLKLNKLQLRLVGPWARKGARNLVKQTGRRFAEVVL